MSTRRLPEAVIWDLDGTVIDSEDYWIIAEREIVERFGGVWTHEDGLAMVGNGLKDTAGAMQGRGVDMSEDDIIVLMSSRVVEQINVAVPWRPGAPELMQSLHRAGVQQAIATMALTDMAEYIADAVTGVSFSAIVAGDQVTQSKPHPEAYLTAAARLGVSARDCVAIEDSVLGILAAASAGAVTIGVPLLLDLSQSAAHVLWPTLAGRHAEDIADVFTEFRKAS